MDFTYATIIQTGGRRMNQLIFNIIKQLSWISDLHGGEIDSVGSVEDLLLVQSILQHMLEEEE